MIGILAGMGPKSTAPFLDKVIAECQFHYGAKYDMDFPPMFIYSCPTPFYFDRPVDHKALGDATVAGAVRLAETGVDFIAIPCNIAHLFYEEIAAAVRVPVLNIVGETLRRMPEWTKRVAILATAGTMDSGLYQSGIMAQGRTFVTDPDWQPRVNRIIADIKTGGATTALLEDWRSLLTDVAKHADAAILACTDLNVAADAIPSPLPLIDASNALAEAVVETYLRHKNP